MVNILRSYDLPTGLIKRYPLGGAGDGMISGYAGLAAPVRRRAMKASSLSVYCGR